MQTHFTSGLRLFLCDTNTDVVSAWRTEFSNSPDITKYCEISEGDILSVKADALLSPANSYGVMDGGIDYEYMLYFGGRIEDIVQNDIKTKNPVSGLLAIGNALIVETNDQYFPYLIVAPTMEIPMSIRGTDHVYHALKAALRAVIKFNKTNKELIKSIAIPGMGTGAGQMDYKEAAWQMKRAILSVFQLPPDGY